MENPIKMDDLGILYPHFTTSKSMDPKGFSAIAGLEVNTSYKIWDYMNQNLMTRVFRLFENCSIYRELLSEIWHPTTFLSSIRLFFA
jgi:hypothetical protein